MLQYTTNPNFDFFFFDKDNKKTIHLNLNSDFEDVSHSTRETLLYGALAIEAMCFFLYQKHLELKDAWCNSCLDTFERSRFASKIKVLKKLEIIDNDLAKKITKIKNVRNSAAHSLLFSGIIYNKKAMPEGKEDFMTDCKQLWSELVIKINGIGQSK